MSEKPKGSRWFKFRLRTLFICVTGIAVAAAWIGYERTQSRSQLELVESLRKRPMALAQVTYEGVFDDKTRAPGDQVWWRRQLGTMLGPRVDTLVFADKEMSDISPLADLPQLSRLTLYLPHLSDLTPLAELKYLRDLNISGCKNVQDISPLANLEHLENAFLGKTSIANLSPLSGVKSLVNLDIRETRVSDLSPLNQLWDLDALLITGSEVHSEEAERLLRSLPNCRINP